MEVESTKKLQVVVKIDGHEISQWSESVYSDFAEKAISYMTNKDVKKNLKILVEADMIDDYLCNASEIELAETADALLEAGIDVNLLATHVSIDNWEMVEKLISHHVSAEALFQNIRKFKNLFDASPYLDMFFSHGYSFIEIVEGLDKSGYVSYEVIKYLVNHGHTAEDIIPHLGIRSIMQNLNQLAGISTNVNFIIERITTDSCWPIDSENYTCLFEKGAEPELILRNIFPSYVDSAKVLHAIITNNIKVLNEQTWELSGTELQNLVSFLVAFSHHINK